MGILNTIFTNLGTNGVTAYQVSFEAILVEVFDTSEPALVSGYILADDYYGGVWDGLFLVTQEPIADAEDFPAPLLFTLDSGIFGYIEYAPFARTALRTAGVSKTTMIPPPFTTAVLVDRVTGAYFRLKDNGGVLVATDWITDQQDNARMVEQLFVAGDEPVFTDMAGEPLTIQLQVSNGVLTTVPVVKGSRLWGGSNNFGVMTVANNYSIYKIKLARTGGQLTLVTEQVF